MSASEVSFRFLLLICTCVQHEKGHLGHEMHFCGGKNIRDNFWESYQNCTHINLHSACAQGKSRMWCRRRRNCKTLRRQSTLVVRFNQAQNTLPHQQLTQLTTNCGEIREEGETALLLLYPRCNIHLWCIFFLTNMLPVQNQYRFKSVFRRVSGRNVGDFWSAF